MESLSLCLSSSFPFSKPHKNTPKHPLHPLKNPLFSPNFLNKSKVSTFIHSKPTKKPHLFSPFLINFLTNYPSLALNITNPPPQTPQRFNLESILTSIDHFSTFLHSKPTKKPYFFTPILINFLTTHPSFALDITNPPPQIPQRINLESILTSIDDFFNKYPYFVAGCTFIWLIVIPLVEEYLKKYKFISALNAFKKLRDDDCVQLLDIRDEKSKGFLGSPNLRMFDKDVVQVVIDESDENGFLKNVLESFGNVDGTCVCILDNFDGNSIKVAELLVKNGFKEAYAIKGGISGKNGWREIQQEFLPPSVHVFPKKKGEKSQQNRESNGSANQTDIDQVQAATTEN